MRVCERIGLLGARFEFGSLFVDQLLLVLIELERTQQADRLQMLLDDVAELGDDRGHELATRLPVATARVEDGFQFLNEERHVAALTEHGRDDAGQRYDPLVVINVLRIDEHLERTALFVLGTLVEDDVVDGNVHRVIRYRSFDLVCRTDQYLGALDLLGQAHDLATMRGRQLGGRRRSGNGGRRFGARLQNSVFGDLAIDLDGSHCLKNPQNLP